jgi:hypothetical protein
LRTRSKAAAVFLALAAILAGIQAASRLVEKSGMPAPETGTGEIPFIPAPNEPAGAGCQDGKVCPEGAGTAKKPRKRQQLDRDFYNDFSGAVPRVPAQDLPEDVEAKSTEFFKNKKQPRAEERAQEFGRKRLNLT